MGRNHTLGWQAQEQKYITSTQHKLIGVGSSIGHMFDNIGIHGENLTIAVLSMNRSSLTIKLMRSIADVIPDFAGEFLIGDNGSDQSEKDKLYAEMQRMPYRCRMVEFDQNYGVAGGRNKLFKEVQTDWLFSLDNDIYFVTDPLQQIRQDIAQLGCHFLAMPLLNEEDRKVFLYGGHLYVEEVKNGVSIGGGSAFINGDAVNDGDYTLDSFLCTFMPGGASIMRKDTFFACGGGYDDGMFVGFEDTEFSLRLFQAGYKIGSCGIACIVHDHPKPENNADREYEKKRFSNVKLLESARYFEKKHGICVWNPMTEEWVNQRLRELLDEGKSCDDAVESVKKPKVLLVIDYPGWALHNIATQIVKHCSDAFDFKLLYLGDIDNISAAFFAGEDCDIIHFLWRSWLADHNTEYARNYARSLGMDPDVFYQKYVASKVICTSVYDHLFLEGDDYHFSKKLFEDEDSPVKAYSVSSQILKDIYDNDTRIRIKPAAVITDGVNLELFQPKNLERFHDRKPGQPLVIGWAGNSMWTAEKEDFKGLHTLLKPAVEQLQQEGYAVELKLCDSNVKKIPHYEMPNYYAQIDLYVCMSKIEGTPNPILECMASGVPFVSTHVGIVPEAAGLLQSEYILQERSVECLKEKLKQILEHQEILEQLSAENLQSIQPWNWRDRAREFIDLWNGVLTK